MSIEGLIERALALGKYDSQRLLFGAAMHGWSHSPVDPSSYEQQYGVTLPADLKKWLLSYGTGAGPFYGIDSLQPPENGTLVLSQHGCGYFDFVKLGGTEAGEVWVDFQNDDPFKWFGSVTEWLDAWLEYGEAEWATKYMQDSTPDEVPPEFIERCVKAARRFLSEGEDFPILQAYPLPELELRLPLVHFALEHGDMETAKSELEAAVVASRDGEAIALKGKIYFAKAEGNAEAGLAAADEALALDDLYYGTRGWFLCEKQMALGALERTEEHDEMFGHIADHYASDLHRQYDHAWILLGKGEADEAATRLLKAANDGTGCDRDAPVTDRLRQVASGLLEALKGAGHADRAAALQSAILRKLS